MQTLQLTPPLLILTMGSPGSGKTFFTRQFSDQFNLISISEDRLRFELFEKPLFNKDEQEIIGRILDYTLEQAMRTKSTIVCDGDFSYATARKRLAELAHKNGYRVLTVWMQTDMQTSHARATKRDRRNPDSRYSFSLTDRQFQQIIARLRKPTEKEDFVVISGKHTFKGQSLTVLRKITELYARKLHTTPQVMPTTPRAPYPRRMVQ